MSRKWRNTHEGLLDSRRHGLSGVLGLSNGNSDKLSSHVSEQGQDESFKFGVAIKMSVQNSSGRQRARLGRRLTVDETQELSEVARLLVRKESLAVLPVSETETFLSGNTTEIDDQTANWSWHIRICSIKTSGSCFAHPSRINPVKVRILIKLSQNSTSPKALIPKVLMAMTKTTRMVTQAAELISEFQNLDDIATDPRGEPAFR